MTEEIKSEPEEKLTTAMKINIFARMIFMPPALMALLHWPANDWLWLDAYLFIIALTSLISPPLASL